MSIKIDIVKKIGKFKLNVQFASEQGVAALLGPSGCGKSLTLRCIAGILTPDQGEIVLNGRILYSSTHKINLPPQRRQVGYLFQNYALFPNMTVEQNILCGLKHEKDPTVRQEKTADMIKRLHLAGHEKHHPHELSGGQQQRTALARILVGQPEIILLDEPFNALDSYLKDKLIDELHSTLKAFDKDTLLVTHSREEAYVLSTTLAIMDKGRLISSGATRKMFTDPGSRTGALLTGCKNIVDARKVGETTVEIPAWGVRFDAGRIVEDNLCAIGIRAHQFSSEITENTYPIRIEQLNEEPFENMIKFRYQTQVERENEAIWWRTAKADLLSNRPISLGVSPEDILLLYQ